MLRFLVCLIVFIFSASQTTAKHAVRAEKLVITDAMVITGVGTPAEGPLDIVISANKIERISAGSPNSEHRKNATLIDAKGKYVMPGFINMHGHTMYNRAGIDMDQPYQYYMWLGSGITSVRDLGSDWSKTSVDREKSKKNEIIAPRLFIYPGTWGHHKADDVRKLIQKYKDDGADGLKFGMMDKETFYAASDEAQKLKLKVANHVGVEDMNAWDNAAMKTTTIEHWYGIPD
ncbi:MAG: amidohydrolase, partial [Calditrichaeota bacterium]|nr:amidohydrolase [Calditrichota bacterium]